MPTAIPASRNLSSLLIPAALIAGLFGFNKLINPDLWWHLAGGRLIWDSGIPRLNTFSHTNPDHPWSHTQWLFDALLYPLNALGGFSFIQAFQVLAIAVAFTLVAHTFAVKSGRSFKAVFLILLVIGLSASRYRFILRPHLVTFIGLALLTNLWERRVRRFPLWCALAGVVWANCHAGILFGVAALLCMAASAALARSRADFRTALLAIASFFAASLVNPNFIYPYVYSLSHADVVSIVPLAEFRSANIFSDRTFFFFLALALACIPWRLARRDYFYALLCLAFAPVAVFAMRVIPNFVIVALPGVAVSLVEMSEALGKRRRLFAPLVLTGLGVAAFFLAASDFKRFVQVPFGWGTDERRYPVAAARFVKENGLSGAMYNDFDQGGYLIWEMFPERRVFQDGRVQSYPPEFFRKIMGSMNREGWARLQEEHGVDFAIVQRRPLSSSRMNVGSLFEMLNWPLVFLDGISLVYVRPGSEALEQVRGKIMPISSSDGAEALATRARQNNRSMGAALSRIDPDRLFLADDFYRFGVASFVLQDLDTSAAFLQRGLEEHPKDVFLMINLAALYRTQGRTGEAREIFTRAASLSRGTELGAKAEEALEKLPR